MYSPKLKIELVLAVSQGKFENYFNNCFLCLYGSKVNENKYLYLPPCNFTLRAENLKVYPKIQAMRHHARAQYARAFNVGYKKIYVLMGTRLKRAVDISCEKVSH